MYIMYFFAKQKITTWYGRDTENTFVIFLYFLDKNWHQIVFILLLPKSLLHKPKNSSRSPYINLHQSYTTSIVIMVRIANVDCIVKFNNEFGDIIINIDKRIKKERKLSKYNIYMKNNFHRIKAIYPELKAPEIMAMVAKEWQNEKNVPKLSISLLNLLKEEELFAMLEHPAQKEDITKIVYGCMPV